MFSLKDLKNNNTVEFIFKKTHVSRGLMLDYFLFDALLDNTSHKGRKYDFDVYLPKFGINLQRPYVWESYQQQEFIKSLFFEKPIEKVIVVLNNDDLKRSDQVVQVIDGKQRLLTIRKFIHNEFPIIFYNTDPIFFKDFDEDCKHHFSNRVAYIEADVFYSSASSPISDEDKIKIFNFYNFSGTAQTEEHKQKLQSLLKSI